MALDRQTFCSGFAFATAVAALVSPSLLVEIEADAVIGDGSPL